MSYHKSLFVNSKNKSCILAQTSPNHSCFFLILSFLSRKKTRNNYPLPPWMIWFWRSELQGGLQSLTITMGSTRSKRTKDSQLVMISLTGGDLADCCRFDHEKRVTFDKTYQTKQKMATVSQTRLSANFRKCLIQNHNMIFDTLHLSIFPSLYTLLEIL